eukprot:m.210847 g.210847  ORF g.210847 m.210847 type:complete len:1191 (-) comp26132_c3_seq4:103-3675(-)
MNSNNNITSNINNHNITTNLNNHNNINNNKPINNINNINNSNNPFSTNLNQGRISAPTNDIPPKQGFNMSLAPPATILQQPSPVASAPASLAATSNQDPSVSQNPSMYRQKIQKHLMFLLHAKGCNQVTGCAYPHCSEMKAVLAHIQQCTLGSVCRENHCGSSRQILQHYNNCSSEACPICQPVKTALLAAAKSLPNINSSGAGPISAAKPSSAGIGGGANVTSPMRTNWQASVPDSKRIALAQKLVRHVTQARPNVPAEHITSLVQRLEQQIFSTSRSEHEYEMNLLNRITASPQQTPATSSLQRRPPNPALVARPTLPFAQQSVAGRSGLPTAQTLPLTNTSLHGVSNTRVGQTFSSPIRAPLFSPQVNTQTVTPGRMPAQSSASNPGSSLASKVSMTAPKVAEPKPASNPKVWDPEELQKAFGPLHEKIMDRPEADPFLTPVDVDANPTYLEVVKNPIDLQTITEKLMGGKYKHPWEYCDDIRQMFQNAWSFNKKTAGVYKDATRLSKFFDNRIDAVMKKLGFCCGLQRYYSPFVLYCRVQDCSIFKEESYRELPMNILTDIAETMAAKKGVERDPTNKGGPAAQLNPLFVCERCFLHAGGPSILVKINGEPKRVKKQLFEQKENVATELEPTTNCSVCDRRYHCICVTYYPMCGTPFVCEHCAADPKFKIDGFSPSELRHTELSKYLEKQIHLKLASERPKPAPVYVRVLSAQRKKVGLRENLIKYYEKEKIPYAREMPYTAKAIFLFQHKEGQKPLCFFGFHVQEFAHDSPEPNQGRVYLSYLDSVHFFQPKRLRTVVYHEVLTAYLSWLRHLGYTAMHIWACPPTSGHDYIFNCHPMEQTLPDASRLQDWYRTMLISAKARGVIHEWYNILEYADLINFSSVGQIPYFDGDFWPGTIEDTLKTLLADKTGTPKSRRRSKRPKLASGQIDLKEQLRTVMDKNSDGFFVVMLRAELVIARPIVDPDPLMECEIMSDRESFLCVAQENHLEFSALRHAYYSTVALLHRLHYPGNYAHEYTFTCNHCSSPIGQADRRFHCNTCEDFDLCARCKETLKHPHPLEQVSAGANAKSVKARQVWLQRILESVVHACSCIDPACTFPSCAKMKQVVEHTRSCPNRGENCTMCKKLLHVYLFHARSCRLNTCPVPYCANLKSRLLRQEQTRRYRAQAMQNSRIAQQRAGGFPGR